MFNGVKDMHGMLAHPMQGTLTLKNGDSYTGEFVDNKMHGQGTLTAANGDSYTGELAKNTLIRNKKVNS